MRFPHARPAGIAACALALAAGSASAETLTYTTPGTVPVTLPTGVARVHIVAVGGRGGGGMGGFGAVVSGDVGVLASGLPETSPMVLIRVAGNGGIGSGGFNGGGDAGVTGFPTLAAGGGGASTFASCIQLVGSACGLYLNEALAAGGGGAGAPALFATGGHGGSAGVAGSAGTSTASLTAAGGGGAGTSDAAGGVGSISSDPNCGDGSDGDSGAQRAGGAGGVSPDVSGHGDAGGGGSGVQGGGGGGGGGLCTDGSGTSGAGGGGGSSNVPAGGSLATDTSGVPYVQISYELEHPSATIAVPVDAEIYEQGTAVAASFTCAPPAAFRQDSIVSCTGTAASGARIATSTLGAHAFTVTATDAYGLTAQQTVTYQVADRTAPRISKLRIVPSAIDATKPHAHATVRFTLSERAQIRVAVRPATGRKGHAARARTLVLSGRAGANRFQLGARFGGRTLRPGRYRLTLVATDRSGNRSRAVGRSFSIAG
ncbi:MAG: hypothetical protein JSS99_14335 [Actinobacteria bacterium]|nr:hypothetical protein [Actinomycetota bacterium]